MPNLLQKFITALFVLILSPSIGWGQEMHEISRQIAPTGTLRAVINLGNPILATQQPSHQEPEGVSVDLARALAHRLQLPLQLIPVGSAAKSVEAVTHGHADIGFFAIDPMRGQDIAFSPAYVIIEGSYLVRSDSSLQRNDEVDRAGHTVVVGKGSAYDLFLTRELKHATLVRVPTSPQVVPFFTSGDYDVAAGVKQQLEADSREFKGLRLLPGHFMLIEQAIGQPATRSPDARTALAQFITEMKANGLIRDSLMRHHIQGAAIAP